MNHYLAQYRQQMSRLRRIQREAEKRGYIFLKSPLPRAVKNPTAKTIERLSSITPTKLRSKGYKTSPKTGELVRQTSRRQEAERHQRELERQRERNRIAIERYEERRRARIEERAKQAEERKIAERQELELKVLKAGNTQELLDIFNVTDPDEIPHWAYSRYNELHEYEYETQQIISNEYEIPNQIDKVDYQEELPKQTPSDYDIEEPPQDYMQGKGIEEPAPYEEQILSNVIIELHSRKNIEVTNFLLEALEDEISALDLQYGEGQGETIMANRFKDIDDNWQSKLEQIDSSDAGDVRDGTFGLLGIIRGGHPSGAEQEELDNIIYDQFKWQSINKRKRAYFRR